MLKIFLSYSQRDDALVAELAKELSEYEYEVFYAGGSILPGQDFQASISEKLRTSDVVVIVVSENSVNSRWVNTEMGIVLGYKQSKGAPFIIPLVIDEVDLPQQLQHIQSLFSRGKSVEEMAAQISLAINMGRGHAQAQEEKNREAIVRVENSATEYIRKSLGELEKREQRNRGRANFWYGLSYFSLAAGVGFAFWKIAAIGVGEPSWPYLIQFVLLSLVVLGLIVALSKFAFVLGKSFMVESLRNADRIHAISFGEFYLDAFGDRADWPEIKEVFQHWNIDKGSHFAHQDSTEFSPELLSIVSDVVKAAAERVNKAS